MTPNLAFFLIGAVGVPLVFGIAALIDRADLAIAYGFVAGLGALGSRRFRWFVFVVLFGFQSRHNAGGNYSNTFPSHDETVGDTRGRGEGGRTTRMYG